MRLLIPAVLALSLIISSCAKDGGTTVGDGTFDQKEQAYFRVAVGASLTAFPAAAAPAYLVTTAILSVASVENTADNIALIALVDSQVGGVDIDESLRPSLVDFMELLKADLLSTLDGNLIPSSDRLAIVKQMLAIVQTSAKARM